MNINIYAKIAFGVVAILVLVALGLLGYMEYKYQEQVRYSYEIQVNKPILIELDGNYDEGDLENFTQNLTDEFEWLKFEAVISPEQQATTFLESSDARRDLQAGWEEEGFDVSSIFFPQVSFSVDKKTDISSTIFESQVNSTAQKNNIDVLQIDARVLESESVHFNRFLAYYIVFCGTFNLNCQLTL